MVQCFTELMIYIFFFASIKYQLINLSTLFLSNSQGGFTKPGGGAKDPELINEEVGINVEGGIFWKKLLQNCNKRGVECSKKKQN